MLKKCFNSTVWTQKTKRKDLHNHPFQIIHDLTFLKHKGSTLLPFTFHHLLRFVPSIITNHYLFKGQKSNLGWKSITCSITVVPSVASRQVLFKARASVAPLELDGSLALTTSTKPPTAATAERRHGGSGTDPTQLSLLLTAMRSQHGDGATSSLSRGFPHAFSLQRDGVLSEEVVV